MAQSVSVLNSSLVLVDFDGNVSVHSSDSS